MVANENFNLNLQNEEEEFVVDFGETTNLGGGGGTTNNTGNYTTAVGYQSYISNANRAVALGYRAEALANGAVALGTGASANNVGEVNIGSTTSTAYGFNNSNYRLLRGVYDGQNDHDAVTVGQVNSVIDAINAALSTNIPHIGASS